MKLPALLSSLGIIGSGIGIVILITDLGMTKKQVGELSHELLLAKQAKDFQSSCMPALNQRTTIRWKQDGLFCIKQEWNGKHLVEVEVKRVETVEGFLAYPLGRKE